MDVNMSNDEYQNKDFWDQPISPDKKVRYWITRPDPWGIGVSLTTIWYKGWDSPIEEYFKEEQEGKITIRREYLDNE